MWEFLKEIEEYVPSNHSPALIYIDINVKITNYMNDICNVNYFSSNMFIHTEIKLIFKA